MRYGKEKKKGGGSQKKTGRGLISDMYTKKESRNSKGAQGGSQ